jgi:hypothetical protein
MDGFHSTIYVPSRDGPLRLGEGSTHVWCQIYVPGSGWVEFDPTNGIVGDRDLIRVGVARTPRQAIPLSGSYWGGGEDELGMDVMVNVKTTDDSIVRSAEAGKSRCSTIVPPATSHVKKLHGIRHRSQSPSTLLHRNLNVTPRIGTLETCRPTSSMSVRRGRLEVTGSCRNDANDPTATSAVP